MHISRLGRRLFGKTERGLFACRKAVERENNLFIIICISSVLSVTVFAQDFVRQDSDVNVIDLTQNE